MQRHRFIKRLGLSQASKRHRDAKRLNTNTAHPTLSGICTLGLGALLPLSAAAYEPTTLLGSFGQTELQQRTGDAVQTACQQLAVTPRRDELQNDLFERCGNMVGNAVTLSDLDLSVADLSLGWDAAAQLGAIVQTVANEELAATKSIATEMSSGQTRAGFARLHALRGGVRFGASMNGISSFETTADAKSDALDPSAGQYGGSAGDSLNGAWGFFANANYSSGDRDTTAREDGFDYDTYGITVGTDYRMSESSVVGGLLSYERTNTDFNANNSFSTSPSGTPGGSVDADSWGIGLYGTHYKDNYYVDGLIGYTLTDYDLDRRIDMPLGPNPGLAAIATNRRAKGSTDASTFSISVGGGMDFSEGSLSFGPFARASYENIDVDGYKESGAQGLNLTVDGQDWDSLTTAFGGQVSYASSQDWGILGPYARLAWVHEFMNDSQSMSAFYTADPNKNKLISITDDPDRNYFELNLGVSAVMKNGVQAFFDYQTLLDHRYVSDNSFTVGFRLEL